MAQEEKQKYIRKDILLEWASKENLRFNHIGNEQDDNFARGIAAGLGYLISKLYNMTQEEKRIYGYAIMKVNTVGHGEMWWDEYYETNEYKIVKTKLFSSEEERDLDENEYKVKYRKEIYDERLAIIPFETEMP